MCPSDVDIFQLKLIKYEKKRLLYKIATKEYEIILTNECIIQLLYSLNKNHNFLWNSLRIYDDGYLAKMVLLSFVRYNLGLEIVEEDQEKERRWENLFSKGVVLNITKNPHSNMSLLLNELDVKALFSSWTMVELMET